MMAMFKPGALAAASERFCAAMNAVTLISLQILIDDLERPNTFRACDVLLANNDLPIVIRSMAHKFAYTRAYRGHRKRKQHWRRIARCVRNHCSTAYIDAIYQKVAIDQPKRLAELRTELAQLEAS